jgi:sugar lactone lactonase YvrE
MELPLVRAPQLPANPSLWLNTGGQALQIQPGRVYLLDFFTSGCINCLHVLPDLAYLESKFVDYPFVVIGVHSPKFDNEKGADHLREAILRHGIAHPVVRDDDRNLWRQYSVRAWPTFVLVDAAGYVIGMTSGEGKRNVLEEAVAALFTRTAGDSRTMQDVAALRNLREADAEPDTPLRFPGKALADAVSKRLFVADTGHHRIVVSPLTDETGAKYDYIYIGDGEPGFQDGPFETSGFRSPQGMALTADGRHLFVADTENHAIRRVDLTNGYVSTSAGTGEQAIGPYRDGYGTATDLNSPWDVTLSPDDSTLYIAMAGSHQIGALHLGQICVFAGSGREARVDGGVHEAAFAQPSGITTDGERLYIADTEASCIRVITLATGTVTTLAGGDLFDFGYRDGSGTDARFQHPLGIAYADGMLYIADTYNHCLRRVNPETGYTETLTPPSITNVLNEPGGLSVADGRIYIADTNHHRIRVWDMATGQLSDWAMPRLCSPALCFPTSL